MSIGGPNEEGLEMMEERIKKDIEKQIDTLRKSKEFNELMKSRGLVIEDFTCYKCFHSLNCKYAWDFYNTHDDCLLLK